MKNWMPENANHVKIGMRAEEAVDCSMNIALTVLNHNSRLVYTIRSVSIINVSSLSHPPAVNNKV